MALKAVVEALDGLDEGVRGLYIEKDGKFFLDVEPVGGIALEDISGLKSALVKEKENIQSVTDKLKAYGDIDPAKAREALEKVDEMVKWTPEQKVQELIEGQRTKLLETGKKATDLLEAKIQNLTKQLSTALITNEASLAITEHKGSIALLLPLVEGQVRMRENTEGEFVPEVIDAKGAQEVNNQGKPMSIEELVARMKDDKQYARAFDGTGASGSGADGSGQNNETVVEDDDLSQQPEQRLRTLRR